MTSDPLSTWVGFLASPAAPRTAMQPLVLDGYLTGIIVAPDLIPPSMWLAGLWGSDEPIFDSAEQMQTVLGAVMDHYNDLIAAIDDGFERLEAKQPLTYRPLFQASGDRPRHDVVRTWMTGFGKAMALTPDAWSALIADKRMQRLMSPLVGFMDVDDQALDPAENIDDLLDEAAAAIPRTVVLLRKLAQLRPRHKPRSKIGRNDPCPCASGRKYKHCCAVN
jgi:uncharacterized protein